jgi:hypothetical protein
VYVLLIEEAPMPNADQQRQRSRVTNTASRKKSPNPPRGYKAIRNQPNALRIPTRERPSLWIAPELGGGTHSNGLWLSLRDEKA